MTAPLLALLHVCDSLFPVGGFAYSEGLEAASAARQVTGAADLPPWLEICLDEAIGRSEGPACWQAWSACGEDRWDEIVAIDEELMAMRPSASARRSSAAMGLRLLRTWGALHPERRVARAVALAEARRLAPALPVAFAVACASAGVDRRSTLEGYAYTRLAGTISAAMRLVPIGHSDAHALLARTLDRVPAIVDATAARGAALESFAPALDIALMAQQYVHSRLFRS